MRAKMEGHLRMNADRVLNAFIKLQYTSVLHTQLNA